MDTLRASAIAMVVFCHAVIGYGRPNRLDFMGLGGVGVDLFFCLSGWLLGSQLCEEFKKTGSIDVRRFWLRRWLRTLPAYYAVLLATVGQSVVQHKAATWWQYPIFLQNYIGMPFFGISWSLCVEEYFYLCVAPLLLLVCRKRRAAIWLPMGALLLIPLASRLATPWVAAHWGWRWNMQMTHLRYDQCAAGVALAALAAFAPAAWRWLCRALIVLAPAGLALAATNLSWRIMHLPRNDFDPLVWTFTFGMLVALANSSQFWRVTAVVPGARYLADRAYAVYLLHVEGISLMTRLFGVHQGYVKMPLWAFILGVWLVALVGAEVLYRYVEQPFMRARERFAASRSSRGHSTLERSDSAPAEVVLQHQA